MRDFKGMKRQRGRNRNGGGGKPQQHNANRAFDSNGPEGIKVRGAAQGVFEKYQQLARDATSGGDRVLAENYLQHAEHYFRVLRAMQPQRPVSEIIGRDNYSANFEIDFEAEPEEAPPEAAQPSEGEGDQPREERPYQQQQPRRDRDNYQRDDRPREERQFREDRPRDRDRDDRPRDERPREDRPYRDRDDRPRWRDRDDRPRDDRPREDRPRDERPREDRPREDRQFRDDRPRDRQGDDTRRDDRERQRRERLERQEAEANGRDPLAVIEPRGAPAVEDSATTSPAPERAPRAPRGAFRSNDGDVSEAPAFLRPREPRAEAEAAPQTAGEEAPKPRRRVAKPKAVEAE